MIEITYLYTQTELGTDADGLTDENTFKTSVLISLLTNARALTHEVQEPTDRGGWWGNAYPDVDGDEIGSKLWLLSGSKVTTETLTRAVQWAEDALQWMIEDGITDNIEVVARRVGDDIMDLDVFISRPDLPSDRWLGTWDAQLAG